MEQTDISLNYWTVVESGANSVRVSNKINNCTNVVCKMNDFRSLARSVLLGRAPWSVAQKVWQTSGKLCGKLVARNRGKLVTVAGHFWKIVAKMCCGKPVARLSTRLWPELDVDHIIKSMSYGPYNMEPIWWLLYDSYGMNHTVRSYGW